MPINKLYIFLFAASVGGWLYLYNFTADTKIIPGGCIVKHTTGLPCPSCGSTGSVLSILHGEFGHAFMLNPLGYVVIFFMLIIPILIITDILFRKKTLLRLYVKAESCLLKRVYAIPFIFLVVVNWIWNLIKYE